jgi:hypothetical protein
MCRSIQRLYNVAPPATPEDVRSAALQYVRKISGSSKPSQANAEVFARAVEAIARASELLLEGLVSNTAPQDREQAAARRRQAREARMAAG